MMTILLDEKEAADSLGLKPPTMRRWRWAGKGPAYCRIGGAIRYRSQDLEAFIAKSEVPTNG
jgi:predicted site-specific integrase-resolvase